MKCPAFGLLAGGVGITVVVVRRLWSNATARQRLVNGTMSDKEKRARGFYPYHNGPFA